MFTPYQPSLNNSCNTTLPSNSLCGKESRLSNDVKKDNGCMRKTEINKNVPHGHLGSSVDILCNVALREDSVVLNKNRPNKRNPPPKPPRRSVCKNSNELTVSSVQHTNSKSSTPPNALG